VKLGETSKSMTQSMFVIYIYQLNSDKMNGWYDRTTTFKGFVVCIVDVDICLEGYGQKCT
jgi:hypothetical protein